MKAIVLALFLSAAIGAVAQSASVARPRILGIDHVSFYTTNPEGVKKLYSGTLGLPSMAAVEPGGMNRYMVGTQWVGISMAPDPKANDRLDHVAFATDDAVALRQYLNAKGVKAGEIQERADHSKSFMAADPEGHRLEFVERSKEEPAAAFTADAVSRRMIHAGFIVQSRAVADHFYRDILGFHIYWSGGFQPNATEWVAMQVPDGTDWLEYMLNQPAHPDLQTNGVMAHISLGVVDMKKAQALLESHGWNAHGDEGAEIGKDGKWQLDVFDPDFSRVELMEFTPTLQPCCSEFLGRHPSESQ